MNLDYLIPQEILSLIQDDLLEIELELEGFACQDRWPVVELKVQEKIIFSGQVKNTLIIQHKEQSNSAKVNLDLDYVNKTDNDTTVDDTGKIIENQKIEIKKWCINNMNIVKNNIIHSGIGQYTPNLSPQKYQYFVDNGFPTGPSTTLSMTENGQWKIELESPITGFLLNKSYGKVPVHQQFELDSIIKDVYDTALTCQRLTGENNV